MVMICGMLTSAISGMLSSALLGGILLVLVAVPPTVSLTLTGALMLGAVIGLLVWQTVMSVIFLAKKD